MRTAMVDTMIAGKAYMKRLTAAGLLVASALAGTAAADERGWPQRAGGIKDDSAQAVTKDDRGNIYVAGRFEGTASFGTFSLVSAGVSDIYVGKLDNVGNWLWVTRAGGGGADAALGVAVDTGGNVYVTGSFQSSATFGSIGIVGSTANDDDLFVAKLDAFGNWRWAAAAIGAGQAMGNSIAVNGASEVFITGQFSASLAFTGSSINLATTWAHPTDNDVVVAKLTAGGAWVWALKAGGRNGEADVSGTVPDLLPADDLDTYFPRSNAYSGYCCNAWGVCNLAGIYSWLDENYCRAAFGGDDSSAYYFYGRPKVLPRRATNAYSDDRGLAIKTVDFTPQFQTTTTTQIYVTGQYQGNFNVLTGLLAPPQSPARRQRDVFVGRVKDLGTAGIWEWVIDSADNTAGARSTSGDSIGARAIDADADGNVYVTGSYTGAPRLGLLAPLPEARQVLGSSTNSTDVPKAISDYTTIQSTINVPLVTIVKDVNVQVSLTHTYDGDLSLYLIAPNGARVLLSQRRGGAGDNYTNTVFDDSSATPISSGGAPFTGTFHADGSLSTLNGLSATGAWKLEISDNAGADTGSLTAWTLVINGGTTVPQDTHMFVAKVADNGKSATWSWGSAAVNNGTFPSLAEGMAVALDQRVGPDQGLYVAGNFSNGVAFVRSDLSTDGTAAVSSTTGRFVTAAVQVGDPFVITSGAGAGTYSVVSVGSETSVTLDRAVTGVATDVSFYVKSLTGFASNSHNRDVLAAKLGASSGGWLWAKRGGSLFDDEARGIAADPSGTTFVGGRMQGTSRFIEGNTPITYREAAQGTYDVSETAYGVSLWFKTTCGNCGLFSVLAGPAGNGGNDRHVYLSGGNLRARVWSDEVIQTTGLSLANGQWHHVIHTFGPGVGQRLYVDGVLRVSGVKEASNFDWQTDVAVGFSNDAATQFFDGTIQNVQIFDRALVAGDVTTLFAYTPVNNTEILLHADGPSLSPLGSGSDAFLASLNPEAPGQWRSFEAWVSGEEVPRPVGVPALQPEIQIGESDGQSKFFWSVYDQKLFAVQPTAALIKWKVSSSSFDLRRVLSFGASDWPTNPQIHVAGAPADLELPPAVQTTNYCSGTPAASPVALSYGGIRYTTNAATDATKTFAAASPGYSVLLYAKGPNPDTTQFGAVLQVVKTVPWNDPAYLVDNQPATIGQKITAAACVHDDPTGKNGFVFFENAPYDGAGDDRAYARDRRAGTVIPVNEAPLNDMVVVWYGRSATKTGMAWPSKPFRFNPQWPAVPEKIVIASELGSDVYSQASLDDSVYTNKRIYNQPDASLPGLNPNEEHATFFPSNNGSGFQAIFALRNDLLPSGPLASPQSKSKPYALLKYQDSNTGEWRFRVFRVLATDVTYPGFKYGGRAGNPVYAPYPVRLMGECSGTSGSGTPFWKDYKNQTWARSAGQITGRYYYPMLPGFSYDLDGNGSNEAGLGACVPWLDRMTARTDCPLGGSTCVGTPIAVKYNICWPDETQRDFGAGNETCAGTVKVIGTDFGFLQVGETLTEPKNGAPDIMHQPSVEVVYDDENPNMAVPGAPAPIGLPDPTRSLVQLIDPFSEIEIDLVALPGDIQVEQVGARQRLSGGNGGTPIKPRKLNFALRSRVYFDPQNQRLGIKGYYEKPASGEPILLLNVLSLAEAQRLKDLSTNTTTWPAAVDALYHKSRNPRGLKLRANYDPLQPRPLNPNQSLLIGLQDTANVATGLPVNGGDGVPEPVKLFGIPGALTAGGATNSNGWVTVAVGNDPRLSPGPVDLKVIKIVCGPYQGQVHVIKSDNVFDEQLTLRHSGDFGGHPDDFNFEWFSTPDTGGTPPGLPDNQIAYGGLGFDPNNLWSRVSPTTPTPANGAIEITIEGADIKTLSDNWFAVRYRGFPVCGNQIAGGTTNSTWAGQPAAVGAPPAAQLGEGWIKRVTQGLNPFETRVKDFHKAATQTYASMIQQLGPRYEGDIALNAAPDAINNVGLIEAYETVLRRGIRLSIDGTPAVNYGPVNAALLNISTRIADFYTLLGNEAYADAQDPTIGFGTRSGAYGTLAPTIFGFQNQVASLLDEELVLLRGRDSTNASTTAKPVYNRFFWNFTNGEGEVAYSQIYGVLDVTGCNDPSRCGSVGGPDGVINESDAGKMYPQGHGDAWGHYLTALTTYYKLLRHPYFTWENRAEAVLVGASPVQVDYLDERKFATMAAAKAKAGAEVVNLTYRSAYVEDPAGQWQGYKDTNADRAWGLAEWAKRSGQAAYFDWVVANSLLPDVDPLSNVPCPLAPFTNPCHTGIQRIDRTTVAEIGEIASQYAEIQTKEDQADFGLNPLGLAKGVVPFDIDPSEVDSGVTHFEQIQKRALKALNNAVQTFDNANQLSQMLRQNQDTLDDLSRNVSDQERDYKNRLIEIFGYPYGDDIGPTGIYPTGYDGPDFLHFGYVDATELTGQKVPPTQNVTGRFTPVPGIGFFLGDDANAHSGSLVTKDIPFTMASGYGLVKPDSFIKSRRAPGEIQRALGDLFTERARYEQSLRNYDALLKEIQDQADLLQANYDLNTAQINIRNTRKNTIIGLNVGIGIAKAAQLALNRAAALVKAGSEAIADGVPKVTVAGLAVGGDFLSFVRTGLKVAGAGIANGLEIGGDVADGVQTAMELGKEQVQLEADIKLETNSQNFQILQRIKELEQLIRQEPAARLECFIQKGVVQQAQGAFNTALAQGERLTAELVAFRARTASDVQSYRYEDMAFRVFRNDALQKYRAQFDLAARYAFLAATAYDYETNLLSTSSGAGRRFLTDIVKQRSLGQVIDGNPVPGSRGLADPLARMGQNFDVLKGQLGFNNPQTETNPFSLRRELFRQRDADPASWQATLSGYKVTNLWDVPEFKRFVRPFAPEAAGAQPGLVIPFSTNVTFGLNFFGWPLGGGDSAYDPTNFATKIRSVGIWFENYDATGLSNTPRVYLVPAGADVLRSPTGNSFATRDWRVADQVLPVPFAIGASDLANPDYIPTNDNLSDSPGGIRRLSSFRAYHLGTGFDASQMSSDSRLIGRSVWNTRWLLIIPGGTLQSNPNEGLRLFINGVSDIQVFFKTYAYSGN